MKWPREEFKALLYMIGIPTILIGGLYLIVFIRRIFNG